MFFLLIEATLLSVVWLRRKVSFPRSMIVGFVIFMV